MASYLDRIKSEWHDHHFIIVWNLILMKIVSMIACLMKGRQYITLLGSVRNCAAISRPLAKCQLWRVCGIARLFIAHLLSRASFN